MTRGTIYMYDKGHQYSTTEFNGDMYRGGHYENVVRLLYGAKSLGDLRKLADTINEEFEYENNDIRIEPNATAGELHLNMHSDNYFDQWFSDYSFIKNITGKDMFVHFDDETITVPDGGIIVCNFNNPDLLYKANGELIDIGILKGTQSLQLDIDKIKQK